MHKAGLLDQPHQPPGNMGKSEQLIQTTVLNNSDNYLADQEIPSYYKA
jgi:hypothetical protein